MYVLFNQCYFTHILYILVCVPILMCTHGSLPIISNYTNTIQLTNVCIEKEKNLNIQCIVHVIKPLIFTHLSYFIRTGTFDNLEKRRGVGHSPHAASKRFIMVCTHVFIMDCSHLCNVTLP